MSDSTHVDEETFLAVLDIAALALGGVSQQLEGVSESLQHVVANARRAGIERSTVLSAFVFSLIPIDDIFLVFLDKIIDETYDEPLPESGYR
jgi:hypothetical protein